MQAPQLSKHTKKEIQQFGHVMLAASIVGCLLMTYKAEWQWTQTCSIVAASGLIVEALCFSASNLMRYPYHAWMWLAFGMSFVMSRVILTALFVVAIIPVGLLLRAFNKDPLQRQLSQGSYWQHNRGMLPHDHYEKLFTVKARVPVHASSQAQNSDDVPHTDHDRAMLPSA